LLPAFGIAASAQTPPTSPAADPASAVAAIPRLGYRKRTLPNGLTVYAVERHATPTVAVQVWYRVGSKDDPAGRGGFAHLFEHLMFKSTRNMSSEMFDRLTEDVGGTNNAYTEDDVTVYQETVPSNHLERILWAEADRMTNLNVDEPNFRSERSVVQEEYRQRVLSDPYGRLFYLLTDKHSYSASPYGRPGIGSITDLQRAALSDVRAFYRSYYRPDNAVVVVVGDFDPSRLDASIDHYLGRVPKPDAPLPPRTSGAEPPRTGGPRSYNETAPTVPLPAVVMTYLTPGIADADAPALRVADIVLSGGESSRLYQSLVYEKRLASEAWAGPDLNAEAGVFQVGAIAAGGKSLDAIQTALLAEVDRLKADGPTPEELTKARSQLVASALRTRETNEGMASALGNAVVLLGDPERVNTDLPRLAAVTAEDVKRVLEKYVAAANQVEIRYTAAPVSARKAGAK
jgi:zinc protease